MSKTGSRPASRPIGVFDSGLGGLTVVRSLRALFPNEDIVYLGDSARLPYGTKSKRQIVSFSRENAAFLMKYNIKALVIACNSSSANAYDVLKKELPVPVIDVIQPAAKAACTATDNHHIGVVATRATVATGAYAHAIKRFGSVYKVHEVACPLFVPLVEEDWVGEPEARSIAKTYLAPLIKKKVDTLILGCTHYPLLKVVLAKVLNKGVTIIDSGPSTAEMVHAILTERNLLSSRKRAGKLQIFVTDLSPYFVKIGKRFLQHPLTDVRVVTL